MNTNGFRRGYFYSGRPSSLPVIGAFCACMIGVILALSVLNAMTDDSLTHLMALRSVDRGNAPAQKRETIPPHRAATVRNDIVLTRQTKSQAAVSQRHRSRKPVSVTTASRTATPPARTTPLRVREGESIAKLVATSLMTPAHSAMPSQPGGMVARAVGLLAPQPIHVDVPLPLPAPKRPPPPPTPAQRLRLHGRALRHKERCLAEAVYFEARDQRRVGQIAVAQVVMNRVFSPYYPHNVCGVIFQNADHYMACQFTFACDGIPERVTEPHAWHLAMHIARLTLAGKIWLPKLAFATHYHANYVHPVWVHEMKRIVRYGAHIFYRPRKWGDGSDETHWSTLTRFVVHIAAR